MVDIIDVAALVEMCEHWLSIIVSTALDTHVSNSDRGVEIDVSTSPQIYLN